MNPTTPHPRPGTLAHSFAARLRPTPRGARLARLLAVRELGRAGIAPATPLSCAVASITAELAANAVAHGRVPGRDFTFGLRLSAGLVRIEVSDARPDRFPPATAGLLRPPAPESAGGRGLLVVDALADRWGCTVADARVKTVWAEVRRLPPRVRS
ncbi:ATP-binding protein [Streptomyces hoynatensis]|uniref:ATP-binding protein n=1 Tax=Streptomyces hoynatensis TaxID=1141874 RepID=A0A3A9Z6Z5_9ACTN|nr:ATP-binding protein [Streptomyces hoynatensis]RKN44010.1 ATP-binding protein [Streptomyces hoynatensis]